jgi:hypothetical protein
LEKKMLPFQTKIPLDYLGQFTLEQKYQHKKNICNIKMLHHYRFCGWKVVNLFI